MKIYKSKFLLVLFALLFGASSSAVAQECTFSGDQISLVDFTFCIGTNSSNLDEAKRTEYKEDFKKYFGDTTLIREEEDNKITWKLEPVLPTGTEVSECDGGESQLALTTITCELGAVRWTSLMTVLQSLCNGEANTEPTQLLEGSNTYFTNLQSRAEHYNKLSVPEVVFTEFSGDSMLKLYRSFVNELNCDDFDPAPDKFYEYWEMLRDGGTLSDEESAKQGYEAYFFDLVLNVAHYEAIRVFLGYNFLVNSATVKVNEQFKEMIKGLHEVLEKEAGYNLSDLPNVQIQDVMSLGLLNRKILEKIENYKQVSKG